MLFHTTRPCVLHGAADPQVPLTINIYNENPGYIGESKIASFDVINVTCIVLYGGFQINLKLGN